MITETSNFKETHFVLSPTEKIDKNLVKNLIEKIEKKQREPFAKIYLTLHPMFLEPILKALQNKRIPIKRLTTNKKVFVFEI